MKLDYLLLRDAAAREDTATIVRTFIRHFPKLESRANRVWKLSPALWADPDYIRLRTPEGSFCYYRSRFYIDRAIYSIDGSHIIMYAPEFANIL